MSRHMHRSADSLRVQVSSLSRWRNKHLPPPYLMPQKPIIGKYYTWGSSETRLLISAKRIWGMINGLTTTSRSCSFSKLDSSITGQILGTWGRPCLSPPQMCFSPYHGVMWSCRSISFLASLASRSSAREWLRGTRQLPSPRSRSCRRWKTCHLPPELLPLRKIPRSCMMQLNQKVST